MDIRPLTLAEIDAGMRLKQLAGWNQTPDDWRRLIELNPPGCFRAEESGQTIGTVTTTVFGNVAWIAMMLVDPRWRGRGIGRALMERALAWLDDRGIASVRLDATDLGRPLYAKLGFVEQFTLDRFAGTASAADAALDPSGAETIATYNPARLDELLSLDRTATGTNRALLLRQLSQEHAGALRLALVEDRLVGYVTSRPGSNARFVGPCVAQPAWGGRLLADALSRHAGEALYVDLPRDHAPARAIAQRFGLSPQRELFRMCRGTEVLEQLDWLWASSGPEKG